MRILVTGAKGQLGSAVVRCAFSAGMEVLAYSRDELDITNSALVESMLFREQPDVVIHCAAYTHVDQAEVEVDTTYQVNAVGTRNLVFAAEAIQAKFVYISTDYVFDGQAKAPIDEWTMTAPIGVYGRSKLAGETYVRDLHSRFFIVRTSWVFGHQGKNFVKTMMRLGDEKEQLKVVADQIGSPTYAEDLAEAILSLIKSNCFGVYHISNSGACSWHEFAEAIFSYTKQPISVIPCTTEEFPSLAPRPAYSAFAHQSLKLNGFKEMRHWRDALLTYLKVEKRQK
ncbi:dTDP-4-dehydrorhamnose reductase [Bacillus sp. JCM 19046]|nr:dTDP-4-dehydrorhamnose reductase [Bacillus sp. JCM 19045]GAF17783.1 dTDP-4-dehydrorhamnose reductase [Bacillus sp. JCM 19046]